MRQSLFLCLSHSFHQQVPKVHAQQPHPETKHRVSHKQHEIALTKQRIALMHKCGKCSESPAKTHCEKQPLAVAQHAVALKHAIEQAYQQAAHHIHKHSAPRKSAAHIHLHKLREQVARHAAKAAPGTNEY